MYDCFEHVALVDRWIVDYFSRILWKQFEAFGTVGNTWVDTFIRERYVSNSTVDLKSDNISGGMLETRSKLLINFMCRLSSGGSGASLHITKSDGGGGGSSETLTELEEAVDLLDQIVNVVNPVINASEIMNLKLMLKQQAVYMCCREERFDVAARVFLRLWRNWKTEREMELRQNIAEVLDSRNRRHHHLETLPYSVMIEKCKVFLRKIYNDMPTPFLMNAADNVWKRVNQSSVFSSEPLADRLQAAEMRNQTLGMEIETDSPADVQSIPTNIVDLTIKERKKKKKAKKIVKAEFPNYKMSFGKVEAKTQFPQQQQQPMNSVHQSMMAGNCQMLFWAGGQMGMPISMDGSNMMMSDQRQPMMMSYLKGEKSATDDWSNLIAPGPSGVFMDPSSMTNANINGQPIIYIAAPNMQFDQNGVPQICMDPFQMASNMAIQNNMFLSNAMAPAAAAASSSAVASTSAAATSVTAKSATQPNEEPSDRIRLRTKLIRKKKKGQKLMWYSYKKPLQPQQPQQQQPQASTNKSHSHEPIKTKTKPLNQASPATPKVIGTMQVDTRRMSKAKEKESTLSYQSVPSNPTGSKSPPRKVKVVPTVVQSNVLPPKRTRYSKPIQNSKPNTVMPVRKEKKPYIDPIFRENSSPSVPPSPKRTRSDIALRRETSYLTVQTKTLRSKVIEMNLPNNSETARLLSKTKADKGKQKVGIKTNPSPVKQDLMVSLTKTKVDAIVNSKAAKGSSSTTPQQQEHKIQLQQKTQPQQQKQGRWPSSSHEAPWTVAEEIQLCKGVKRLGNNEWKKLCKLYLPHRIASEVETKWEKMAKAKKQKKK